MSRYSIVSLFSGAGGLDLGFVQTGKFKVVFANDVLLPSARTYSSNFKLKLETCGKDKEVVEAAPNTVLACDVSRIDFSGLRSAEVDLVVGGPPCQDFSIVRGPPWDRKGIEVKRGRLYSHFVRALVALQPKIFVFENVPGLVSANKGLAYKLILEDFSNLSIRWSDVKCETSSFNNGVKVEGYELIFADVVDFSRLGVPQRRERLVVVGLRKDLVKNLTELWEFKGIIERALSGKRWLFRKYPLTPIEVFEGKRLDELGERYKEVMKKWDGVWEEVGTAHAYAWREKVWSKLTLDVIEDYLKANGLGSTDREELEEALTQHEQVLRELGYYGIPVYSLELPDGTTELPEDNKAIIERMKRIPPDENHEFVRGTKWEVEGRGISLVYRRIHPLKPSYTIVAYGGGGTHGYHYDRDRATLTLRERARLQTFPDSFLFSGRRAEIRAQIGEAVPPLAAKRIAEALAEILEQLG
ncbi:MAG: DNA cytosine methyltransferase [Thermofilaceae archaeon]|uniref:DNA cytosine methyltransferase n=1 Tax=Pyrobaculum sp. TaxID=2004705 RepID=UPI003163E972